MRILNLTNSPHDLINEKGEKVRLPARGHIEGFRPHPQHAALYRSIGYFRVEDEPEQEEEEPKKEAQENQEVYADTLRNQYRDLAGKDADGRWNEKRLLSEIEKLKA